METTASPLPKCILILGTTGFLGPNIVLSLLAVPSVSKIYCLNRSADGEQRTISELLAIGCDHDSIFSRLEFVVADMTQPNLGIGEDLARRVASEIDEIVFNAWNPNWGLALVRFDPLLKAVRNVIHFCDLSTKRARIIFISSVCAMGNWPRVHPNFPLIPEMVAHDDRHAMPHGYGLSKAAAERQLAQASLKSGLPVVIMRAGQIGGPSAGSPGTWPVQGWLYSIIKKSLEMGSFPSGVQALDWLPVDVFAGSVANVVLKTPRRGAIEVFNMVHPEPAPWELLPSALRRLCCPDLHSVRLSRWLETLRPGTFKLYQFLKATGDGRENDMTFCVENARTILPEVAPITEDLLLAWLQGWDLSQMELKARL
jgi:thioester reductase-like protein